MITGKKQRMSQLLTTGRQKLKKYKILLPRRHPKPIINPRRSKRKRPPLIRKRSPLTQESSF